MRLLLLLSFLLIPLAGMAQNRPIPIGDPVETYLRIFPFSSGESNVPSFVIRPVSLEPVLLETLNSHPHPWQEQPVFRNPESTDRSRFGYKLYHPVARATWNSSYPFGQNDGALWQGRGTNYAFSMGGEFHAGPLEIRFRPEVGYSGNRTFEMSPLDVYRAPYGFPYPHPHNPDALHRFGDDSRSWFHPGQSTVQLQYWGVAAGVSTANIWMGPSLNNPISLSNNGPGFFHGFLRTTRPLATPVGSFEVNIYWGGLQESDYFDTNPENNLGFATGLLTAWSPSFIRGLTLGMTRTQFQPWPDDGLKSRHLTRIVSPDLLGVTDLDDFSQIITLFGRWAFPQYGLETWFEWGLNDGRSESRSLSVILEHSRSYNLGLIKRFHLPQNRWLVVLMEMTQLEHDRTHLSFTAAQGTLYEHYRRRQGWAHQGQLLGAGIGVGSNNQLLRADLYDERGLLGVSVNRIELHNDKLRRSLGAIRQTIREQYPDRPELADLPMHELQTTEFRFGVHSVLFLPHHLELQADFIQSRQLNRYHMPGSHTWNTNLSFTVRYKLPGGAR